MQRASEAFSFNWETIFSDNICKQVNTFRAPKTDKSSPLFYMSTYIMDVIFFSTSFPTMGGKWTLYKALPIHIVNLQIWEENYGDHFYAIFHFVIIPFMKSVFIQNLYESQKMPNLALVQLVIGILKKTSPI